MTKGISSGKIWLSQPELAGEIPSKLYHNLKIYCMNNLAEKPIGWVGRVALSNGNAN
jgi:hypothetical protein